MVLSPFEMVGVITGSMIVDQLFCEVLLDIKIRGGFHKRIEPSEARKITERFMKEVRTKMGRKFLRTTVAGSLDDLYFIISPDAILVENGVVKLILRTRIRKSLRIYETDFLYLQLTSLIIYNQKLLDVNSYVSVLVAKDPSSLRIALKYAFDNPYKSRIEADWKYIVRVFDQDYALGIFRSLSEYWKGQRAPRPSNSFKKCQSCSFKTKCPIYLNTLSK